MTDKMGGLTAEHPLARELAAQGPVGWQRADAVFAVTVAGEIAGVVYSEGEQAVPMNASEVALALVREMRAASARSSAGPWWRMLVMLSSSGELEVEYDYGAEPFPAGQLFAPEAYRADLEAYPRDSVPVWLAAYIGHGDRQVRTPQVAATQARTDRLEQVWAVLAENEFPPFPVMWVRWATIAAAFVATESDWGPRMLPWMGIFEGSARGGSTLYALPAGRAVLSGGVWNAPTLDATYNRGAPMPKLYAGAPDWVADSVLDPRAASGLLSFCYWWDGGHWYRGESPSAKESATAVPGVWTEDTVIGIVTALVDSTGEEVLDATAGLLSAAAAGGVTRETLITVFGDDGRFDIDGALHQYSLAGLVSTVPEQMPAPEAIARVRDYITGRGIDTDGYPLSQLVADRFEVGWMVYVPVASGEIAIGRAIFYIGDDGVLEPSSSSIAPAVYMADFTQRFSERHGSVTRTG
ncbi:hypothetical protein [Nocardia sp. NPDC057440]|uniref:hypothetical protein n=1 Tax=Nocardia sp. NPDC057440 TaxID=3346134 RepID=UPI0036729078